MAVKTFYFKNTTVNGALSLQDGGTAPGAAITGTGWTVAKLAAAQFSLMAVGQKRASTAFAGSDALTTPGLTAASAWRSEQPLVGSFANTNWTLTFRLRAVSAASSQAGRVKVRIWKSTSADGSSGNTQLTTGILTGTTTAALSTTASQSSTVTWTPGSVISFLNEYLFVQCEWETTTASGSNNGDSVFYIESTAAIGTSDFTLQIAGTLADTEDPDTAALGGLVGLIGSLADTEDADAAAFTGTVQNPAASITGVLAVNEDWPPRRPVLLLHADGPDGSTAFPDDSGNAHVVTPRGAAQVDAGVGRFGGAARFETPDDYLELDGASDFAFGAGDFSVDTVAVVNAYDNFNLIDWGGSGPKLKIGTDGKLHYLIGGAERITGATVLALNTGYHVGVSRAVGTTRLFLEGVQEGGAYVGSEVIAVSPGYPRIGTRG